jgi:AcrR family transcriptional regulator
MGIAERKEREKVEMRDRILEAATAMFLEDGYEKTSIRNIAEKIEYSPATIYLYFKDKDDLFFAIHEIGFGMLLREMEKLMVIKNPLERLRALGIAYVDFALKNPEYYDLMFIMRAPMNAIKEARIKNNTEDQCWVYGESTLALLQSTVVECVEQKLIRPADPLLTSMFTWSTVHGMVALQIRDRFGVLNLSPEVIKQMLIQSLDLLIVNLKG